MKGKIRTLLLSTVAGLALVFAVPGSSEAASVTPVTYGRCYRPHVGYYYSPGYRYSPRYYYGPRVGVYRYPDGYYGRYHYRPYSYGYRPYSYGYGYGGLRVGPFGFGVW